MSQIRVQILIVFAAVFLLVSPEAATQATPLSKQINKPTALASYTILARPQSLSQVGEGTLADHPQASSLIDRFGAWLPQLAREGHVQNIELRPDGTLSLLADQQAVARWQAESVATKHAIQVAGQATTSTIAGIVTGPGASPIQGATVSAFSGGLVLTTTTAADGSYSLTATQNGDYQVGVWAVGYEWQPAVLVAVPSGASDVNFALVPQNLTIHGTITNQNNLPLAGVQVAASDLIVDNFTAGDSTVTDAAGTYTLTVSAATYEVRAFNPPFGTLSHTVVVPPNASGVDFRFDQAALYTVSGTARQSNGQPLPGAEFTFATTYVPFNSCDSPYSNLATAGADGSYSVALPAGSYRVYVNWPNEFPDHWVINASTLLTVTGNLNGWDMSLPAVGTIRGTVLDPGGQPLPNATVFAWHVPNGSSTWFDGFFQADSSGNYVVTATLGTHYLLAFSDQYVNSPTQTVQLNGPITGVNMQVGTGIAVGGTLTGSDGPALRWASVVYPSGDPNNTFNRHATVYYNGRWRAVLPPGSATLHVSQPYYVDQQRTVSIAPNPPAIDFTLTRETLRLVGRVTNTQGGAGLCDTYMTADDITTRQQSLGNTTGDGDYALQVAPGTYDVWPYKYGSNSSEFTTRVTVPPVPPGINFSLSEILTPTPTPTTTPLPTSTATPPTPGATGTPCVIHFSDVQPSDYFYTPVQYLTCRGVISGYADGTFRPYATTTRGQLAKLIVLSEGWSIDTSGGPHFSDVPPSNPFYGVIETAFHHNVLSGYADGTFGWGNNVTRGQLSKILVLARGWPINTSGGPHFSDVPPSNPFYSYVETAFNRQVISGYADGTFRWGSSATRGQIAKILYIALTSP